MPIEDGQYISDFVPTNPLHSDFKSEGPDHFHILKQWIQNTFPNIDNEVAASPADLNNSGMPIGALMTFAGTGAPAGFLVCSGQEVAIEDYPDLYAVIGDTWNNTAGAEDPEEGNFRLPPSAFSYLRLVSQAAQVGEFLAEEIGPHTHATDTSGNHTHGYSRYTVLTTNASGGSTQTWNNVGTYQTGGGGNHSHSVLANSGAENRPKSIQVLLCIRSHRL